MISLLFIGLVKVLVMLMLYHEDHVLKVAPIAPRMKNENKLSPWRLCKCKERSIGRKRSDKIQI